MTNTTQIMLRTTCKKIICNITYILLKCTHIIGQQCCMHGSIKSDKHLSKSNKTPDLVFMVLLYTKTELSLINFSREYNITLSHSSLCYSLYIYFLLTCKKDKDLKFGPQSVTFYRSEKKSYFNQHKSKNG